MFDTRECAPVFHELYAQIESRLERLFVQYSNAEIDRETFIKRVLAERRKARIRIDLANQKLATGQLSDAVGKLQLDQSRDAMAVAQWCLEWAEGIRHGQTINGPAFRT